MPIRARVRFKADATRHAPDDCNAYEVINRGL